MSIVRLRLAPVEETMFPPRAPFFRSRLRDAVDATAATTPEDRDVACDVAEEAVPALPSRSLPQRGNLPVSPYAPSPAHRPQGGL
jgi:hypothetical protein